MLGDDETVSLAHAFVDLTIIKQKPRPVKVEDETTFNEIAFLRKIANKEIEIFPVDFTEELKSYTADSPEIWYLTGMPTSGNKKAGDFFHFGGSFNKKAGGRR